MLTFLFLNYLAITFYSPTVESGGGYHQCPLKVWLIHTVILHESTSPLDNGWSVWKDLDDIFFFQIKSSTLVAMFLFPHQTSLTGHVVAKRPCVSWKHDSFIQAFSKISISTSKCFLAIKWNSLNISTERSVPSTRCLSGNLEVLNVSDGIFNI